VNLKISLYLDMFKNEKYMIKEWEIIKKLIVCLQQHLNS